MAKYIENNPTPESSYGATIVVNPLAPEDHEHDFQQIGVEHHWDETRQQYEVRAAMGCKSCSFSATQEWVEGAHQEFVVFPRDENGGHIR